MKNKILNDAFYNSLKLLKFMARRERLNSIIWVLALVLTNASVAALMGLSMLATYEERADLLSVLDNPALLAMVGPLYSGANNIGSIYALMMLVFMGIAVAVMNIFLISRHTRTDEEAGRLEVLRSLPLGRLANINAAALLALIVNFIMSLLFVISMYLVMILTDEPMGFEAAALWGCLLGGIGLVFAAITALFCQLSANSRSAMGYSFLAMGIFYLLRAGADAGGELEYLAYLSPFGIASRSWVYIENLWTHFFILLAMAILIAIPAYALSGIRDIDQGVIPARPGRPSGGIFMRNAFGLNLKLLSVSIVSWAIVLFFLGLSYGTVLEDIETFIAGNEMYRQLILAPAGIYIEGATTEEIIISMNVVLSHAGFNIVQMFSGMTGFFMAMMSLIPVIIFALKAKSEERAARTELILAGAVSRVYYLSGFLLISFVCAIIFQLAHAIGMYLFASSVLANPADLPFDFLVRSALAYVPALWLFCGLTFFLIGALPKFVNFIWAYYVFSLFVLMYGRMLPQLEWTTRLSPMGYAPQLPVDEINALTLLITAAFGIALAILGVYFYGKRDINV